MTTPRARGFSLIEFMIAITVSMIILAALTATFVSNSRSRLELDRANQQIENGRYALMAVSDDLQLAGYLSTFNILNEGLWPLPVGAAKPDPCVQTPATLLAALGMHVQGYDNTAPTCLNDAGVNLLADYKLDTDVLVVRRASTCVRGSANCPDQAGAPYLQPSRCEPQLNTLGQRYRLETDTSTGGPLNRTMRDCLTRAPMHQYLVHVYFVANNDEAGDGIPTLKRAELVGIAGNADYRVFSLANGIENLQVEYGIDTHRIVPASGLPDYTAFDGRPDAIVANPDLHDDPADGNVGPYAQCAANPNCARNWGNVVSVKVSLLARNTDETRDYRNDKVYTLGLNAAGGIQCAHDPGADGACDAFNNGFKRHVFQTAVRLNNAAGRRE